VTRTAALCRDAEAAPSRDAGPCFEVYDREFEAVLGRYARLALVAETDAHEGPVYIPGEDALYFTTVPQVPGVYASASSGVQVFNPAGDLIGQINLPGAVNFTFGGPRGQLLFITTDTAVWAAVLATAGAGPRSI